MAFNQNFTIPDSGIYVNGVATFTSSMSVNNNITTTGSVIASNSTQFANIGSGTGQFGNSTFYSSLNQTSVAVTNTTFTATVNPNGLSIGNTTANVTANNTLIRIGTASVFTTINATSANIGGNLNVVGTSQFGNDLIVTGNLIITGTTTTVNTINLNVVDNIITLISNSTPSTPPILNAGFEVNRGSGANVSFYWDETNKYFSTNTANLYVGGLTTFIGNSTFSGDLTVSGNTTLGSTTTDGVTLRANTVTIISNASFNSGLLYIDTLNSRVGIGTNVPGYKLAVTGDISATGNAVVSGSVLATTLVNTATFSVGSLFTANSTLVNTAAINVTNQVNTATLYATTSANIASVVQANTSGLYTTANVSVSGQFIGPATGLTGTASSLTSGNSINLNGLAATAYVSNASFLGTAYTFTGAHTYNANLTVTGNSTSQLLVGGGAFVANSTGITGTLLTVSQPNITAGNTTNFNGLGATSYVSNSALTGYGYVNNSVGTAFNSSNLAGFGVTTFVSNSALTGYNYINATTTATTFVSNSALTGYGYVNSSVGIAFNSSNLAGFGVTTFVSNSALTGYAYVNSSIGTAFNSSNLAGFGVTTFVSNASFLGTAYTFTGVRTHNANLAIGGAATSQLLIGGTAVVANSAGIYGTLQTTLQPNITANNANNLNGLAATAYVSNSALTGSATAYNAGRLLGSTWAAPQDIGLTTPAQGYFSLLQSTGNIYLANSGSSKLFGILSDNITQFTMIGPDSNSNNVFVGARGATVSNVNIWGDTNTPVGIYSNSTLRAFFAANGNVGIGKSNPTVKLDITGAIVASGNVDGSTANFSTLRASQNMYLDTSTYYLRAALTDGTTYTRIAGVNASNSVFLGAIDAGALDVRLYAPTSAPINIYTNAQFHSSFAANGNFGVNTVTPVYQLDVAGDIRTTTQLLVGTTTIANSTGTYATHLGGLGPTSYVSNSALTGYNYVNTTGNFTVSGNIAFTGANSTINGVEIGYLDIPQRIITTTSSIAASDAGYHLYNTNTTGTFAVTVPNNFNVPLRTGTAVTLINGGNTFTVSGGTGVTIKLAGTSSTGTRTLANSAVATLIKVAADTWFISGAGVS